MPPSQATYQQKRRVPVYWARRSDGYWWWQSTEARAAKWVVPQREVLAAGRVGWDGGSKKVGVNESRGNSGEQE
jgi:hypothetical protein